MKKYLMFSVVCLVGLNTLVAYGESIPRRLATDHRVKLVQYDPNNIVILKGRYGYQTHIIFAANETVQNVSLGDSLAWQVVPVHQHLFVKPVTSSKTNMAVLTNLHSYTFQLDSTDPVISPTYQLQFIYSNESDSQSNSVNTATTFEPDQLNWKYSFTGNRSLAPITAFDNGQFTYFKFNTDGMSHLPAVFTVDKDQQEALINYHMQGSYLVMHAVAKQFTLRDGNQVTSIYNDFAIGDWKTI